MSMRCALLPAKLALVTAGAKVVGVFVGCQRDGGDEKAHKALLSRVSRLVTAVRWRLTRAIYQHGVRRANGVNYSPM